MMEAWKVTLFFAIATCLAGNSLATTAFEEVVIDYEGLESQNNNALGASATIQLRKDFTEAIECEEKGLNCSLCVEDSFPATVDDAGSYYNLSVELLAIARFYTDVCVNQTEELTMANFTDMFFGSNDTMSEDQVKALAEMLFPHHDDHAEEEGHDDDHADEDHADEDHADEDHDDDDHHNDTDTDHHNGTDTDHDHAGEDDHDHAEEGDGHDHEEADHHDDEDDHDHDHEEEHEDVELCFNVETLLDSAGITDHESGVSRDAFPALAAQLVYYLATGYEMTDNCEPLPTRGDMFEALLTRYAVNGIVTTQSFSQMLSDLQLGTVGATSTTTSTEDDHSGHDHRKKRNTETATQTAAKCLSAPEILAIHGVNSTVGVSSVQLYQISPTLIQQFVSQACASPSTTSVRAAPALSAVYGYGTLSVLFVTLCAILGILVIPLMASSVLENVLIVLIAMGSATLSGDAFLHLLPTVLADHSHALGGAAPSLANLQVEQFVWYMLMLLLGIYLFYFLELFMHYLRSSAGPFGRRSSSVANVTVVSNNNARMAGNGVANGSLSAVEANELPMKEVYGDSKSNLSEPADPPSEQDSKTNVGLALMILIGDGVHNFADGLAIGAAYRFGLLEGFATTIAIFCHELPHEFGDYAVLLSAGVNKWKALGFNFLSALSAFIGLYIGIAIGDNEMTRAYIFSLTAGMFIYIALTDLFPELLKQFKNSPKPLATMGLQSLGFAIGLLVMILLAVFEEYIVFPQ